MLCNLSCVSARPLLASMACMQGRHHLLSPRPQPSVQEQATWQARSRPQHLFRVKRLTFFSVLAQQGYHVRHQHTQQLAM